MEALGTTLGECIVLEAVCVHHLCLLHVFANTDEGTQTRTRSTHSVHINPETHIPRLIPLQLRPIRARVKGSLRGGGEGPPCSGALHPASPLLIGMPTQSVREKRGLREKHKDNDG